MKQDASTSEVIKIKEAFLSLSANKIDQINNIVKGNPKVKPCIQITTKCPSKKYVTISMSSEKNLQFMKNSSLHIANMNRSLRNTKSEVLIDFIQSNLLGIIVVTSKVALQSDLQIIEQYIKNMDNIDS